MAFGELDETFIYFFRKRTSVASILIYAFDLLHFRYDFGVFVNLSGGRYESMMSVRLPAFVYRISQFNQMIAILFSLNQ